MHLKAFQVFALNVALASAGMTGVKGPSLKAVEEKAEEKSYTWACCISFNDNDCKDFTFDYQFEGFSNHG